jgi:hypothetical protein
VVPASWVWGPRQGEFACVLEGDGQQRVLRGPTPYVESKVLQGRVCGPLQFAWDSQDLVTVVTDGTQMRVATIGSHGHVTYGEACDEIRDGRLAVTPTGARTSAIAYVGLLDGSWHVMTEQRYRSGRKVGSAYEAVTDPAWLDDEVCYGAQQGGSWILVHGSGKLKERFDFISNPVRSADNLRVVFPLCYQGAWCLMLYWDLLWIVEGNGRATMFNPDRTVHHVIPQCLWSPAGSVLELRKIGLPSQCTLGTPVFSADHSVIAYPVNHDDCWSVAYDDQVEEGYEAVAALQFLGSSHTVAYKAQVNTQWRVVVAGVPERCYDTIETLVCSPNGARWAYVASTAGQRRLIVDGVEQPPVYEDYGTPVFSPDSATLVYPALRDGVEYMVVHGQPGTPHYRIAWDSVAFESTTTFSYVVQRLDQRNADEHGRRFLKVLLVRETNE